mgnify:CR=1 FL=1
MKRENWNVKSYGFIQQGFCASGADGSTISSFVSRPEIGLH